MSQTEWVVVDFRSTPVVQRCLRCGDSAPMPTGRLDYCADVLKAFAKAHRRCRGN